MSNILYLSSEVFPLIKTGGLADVAGSLPVALKKAGESVRLVLPAYPAVKKHSGKMKIVATHSYYNLAVTILESRLPGSTVKTWLVDCPAVFERPGGPYADQHGIAWDDNALRFTVFCHAAVDIALDRLSLGWQPDVVHCNDWQTGLVPALLSLHEQRPACVFTIHNLAYQGNFPAQTFTDLHLPGQLWHLKGVEFYGQFSFMKAGLAYADKINAVSPNYAREILLPEFGYGLDGLLVHRSDDLTGILNGIDQKHWNPGTDELIAQKYNSRSLDKKVINKTALQKKLKLAIDKDTPMIGMVGRLVEQKGLTIILQALGRLMQLPLQLVILGTGDTHFEIQLTEWASKHPDKLSVTIGYNEQQAHQIEAACDIYLMPSTFEPCGLNQLYSLRYGSLPLVTNVGGLTDTVTDANTTTIDNKTANGFIIEQPTATSLITSIKKSIGLYQDKTCWQRCQKTAMAFDSSWTASARRYIDLYQQALASQ